MQSLNTSNVYLLHDCLIRSCLQFIVRNIYILFNTNCLFSNMEVGDTIDICMWVFETLFGALHVLMMIFLILKRRKKVEVYNSFYYTIFLWIGVFDILYLINVSKFNTFLKSYTPRIIYN